MRLDARTNADARLWVVWNCETLRRERNVEWLDDLTHEVCWLVLEGMLKVTGRSTKRCPLVVFEIPLKIAYIHVKDPTTISAADRFLARLHLAQLILTTKELSPK